jgi:hypothetical protein
MAKYFWDILAVCGITHMLFSVLLVAAVLSGSTSKFRFQVVFLYRIWGLWKTVTLVTSTSFLSRQKVFCH